MFKDKTQTITCKRSLIDKMATPSYQSEVVDQYKNTVFWDIAKELEVWNNQPKNHRYEYLTAIKIFLSHNYLSLVEKYGGHGQGSHTVKRDMLIRVAGERVAALLEDTGVSKVQCPDLFVFTEDLKDWCFVEVKGPSDRLRPQQKEAFDYLSEVTRKPWYLFEVKVNESS